MIKKYSKEKKKKLSIKFKNIIKQDIKKSKFIKGSHAFLRKYRHLNKFISSGTPQTELKNICKKRISHLFKEILGSPLSKKTYYVFKKNTKLIKKYYIFW